MSRQRPLALLTVLAMLPAAPPALAQQQAPLSRAELVQLDVIVTDADGKPVRGLTEADFEVLEDKKAQRITNFVFVEGRLRGSYQLLALVMEKEANATVHRQVDFTIE